MDLRFISLLWLWIKVSFAADDILVQLKKSKEKIHGHILRSANGKDYYAFQEIPYASPPIGQNRFKIIEYLKEFMSRYGKELKNMEPKDHGGWNGTLNATMNKKVCMQNNDVSFTKVPDTMEISEDCLFLNVYTPVKPRTKCKTMPVLFWIHSGGYFYGSGAYQYYDPKYFMDYGIVVVTMNYRLGSFGFLTTADDVIPGNLGLKDQEFAFQWVIQNVECFGGDPKSITVAGQSSGAFSAGYLQLSKKLRGLVRGFILESGSPLSPNAFQDDPRHYAFKMGKALDPDFASNDSKDLLNILLKASSLDILMANVTNDRNTGNQIENLLIWQPIIEKRSNPNAIVTSHMHEALIRGDFTQVPLLTGFCSEESKFFVSIIPEEIAAEGRRIDQNISLILDQKLNIEPLSLKTASSQYKHIYTTGTFERNPGAYVKYLSDASFCTPIIRHAELASKFSPVFLYQFSYEGKMDGLSFLPDVPGADHVAHTAEVKYIFGGLEGSSGDAKDYSKSDQLTMRRMLALWTNFIKHQNPTPRPDDLLHNVKWPLVRAGEIQYLNINRTLEVLSNPKKYNEVKRVLNNYIKPPLNVY